MIPARYVQGAVLALLAIAQFLPLGPTRMVLFALVPGLLAVLRVTPVVELGSISASVFVPLLVYPLLTWCEPHVATAIVFAVCLALAYTDKRTHYYVSAWEWTAQVWLLLAVLVPVVLVAAANGMQGGAYGAHSWFGRDTAYLYGLTQEAVNQGGFPRINPWLAGVDNTYASVLHMALATIVKQSGLPAPIALHWLLPVYLVAGPCVWVWGCIRRGCSPALAALGVLGALLVRPDLFVYAQSQSVAFGVLGLVLVLAQDHRYAAGTVAAVLFATHPVLGSVALGLVFFREYAWFGALLTCGAFFAMGHGTKDPTDAWFWTFNAPRFLILAGLVALPYYTNRSWQWASTGLSLVLALSFGWSIRPLLEEPPAVADPARLAMYAWINEHTRATDAFVVTTDDFLLPAFTGRVQSPVEARSTYGRIPVDAAGFDALVQGVWDVLGAANHLAPVCKNGYNYVLAKANADWHGGEYREGGLRLVHTEGPWLLLERDGSCTE